MSMNGKNRLYLLAYSFGVKVIFLSIQGCAICPTSKAQSSRGTMRLMAIIDLPGYGIFSYSDYLTIVRNKLYVAYTSQNKLVIVDTIKNRVKDCVEQCPGIHGFAPDPLNQLGFTSNGSDHSVGVISLKSDHLLEKINVESDPDAIIYNSKNKLIYVASHTGSTASLIDPITRKKIAIIFLGGKAEFAQTDPKTGYIYQNLEDTSETVVVDPHLKSVIERYQTSPGISPTGLAIDLKNHRIFIVCGNKKFVVLDQRNGRIIASLPIGSAVDAVGYDPRLKRIYTANAFGSMTIIQQESPDDYRVIDTLATAFGGHTLVVDPVTHRVYVVKPGVGRSSILVFEPTQP
jgi:DNA-binding beta-propeller fold protein YncE